MKVTVNGETIEMPEGSRLAGLLTQVGLLRKQIVVEVNRDILQPSADEQFVLSEGDQVELIQFVGGG
jgi:sulfur carrier protein